MCAQSHGGGREREREKEENNITQETRAEQANILLKHHSKDPSHTENSKAC